MTAPVPPVIVVVEDDPLIVPLLARAVRAKITGTVYACRSLAEGLAQCQAILPQLLITDYHLGDGNGLELARFLQQLAPGTPCILLSGTLDAAAEVALAPAGILAFLSKPVNLHDLLQAIRAALP